MDKLRRRVRENAAHGRWGKVLSTAQLERVYLTRSELEDLVGSLGAGPLSRSELSSIWRTCAETRVDGGRATEVVALDTLQLQLEQSLGLGVGVESGLGHGQELGHGHGQELGHGGASARGPLGGLRDRVRELRSAQSLPEIFHEWSRGAGCVDKEQLEELLRAIPGSCPPQSSFGREAKRLMRQMDRRCRGLITYDDFALWASAATASPPRRKDARPFEGRAKTLLDVASVAPGDVFGEGPWRAHELRVKSAKDAAVQAILLRIVRRCCRKERRRARKSRRASFDSAVDERIPVGHVKARLERRGMEQLSATHFALLMGLFDVSRNGTTISAAHWARIVLGRCSTLDLSRTPSNPRRGFHATALAQAPQSSSDDDSDDDSDDESDDESDSSSTERTDQAEVAIEDEEDAGQQEDEEEREEEEEEEEEEDGDVNVGVGRVANVEDEVEAEAEAEAEAGAEGTIDADLSSPISPSFEFVAEVGRRLKRVVVGRREFFVDPTDEAFEMDRLGQLVRIGKLVEVEVVGEERTVTSIDFDDDDWGRHSDNHSESGSERSVATAPEAASGSDSDLDAEEANKNLTLAISAVAPRRWHATTAKRRERFFLRLTSHPWPAAPCAIQRLCTWKEARLGESVKLKIPVGSASTIGADLGAPERAHICVELVEKRRFTGRLHVYGKAQIPLGPFMQPQRLHERIETLDVGLDSDQGIDVIIRTV